MGATPNGTNGSIPNTPKGSKLIFNTTTESVSNGIFEGPSADQGRLGRLEKEFYSYEWAESRVFHNAMALYGPEFLFDTITTHRLTDEPTKTHAGFKACLIHYTLERGVQLLIAGDDWYSTREQAMLHLLEITEAALRVNMGIQ